MVPIAYAALVEGLPEAIAADAVHGESQLASIADANPGTFQRIFNVHRSRGPCRPRGGGRHRVPDHGDGPQLGGNTSILQRHVGVSGRRCHPARHGIFGEASPTVPCRDASVAGLFSLRTQHAWPTPLRERTRRGNARRLRLRLRRRARPATGREQANAR